MKDTDLTIIADEMHLTITVYIMPSSIIIMFHINTVSISTWLWLSPVSILRLISSVEVRVTQRPNPRVLQPNPDMSRCTVYDLVYVILFLYVIDSDQICVFLSAVSLSFSPVLVLIHKVILTRRWTDHGWGETHSHRYHYIHTVFQELRVSVCVWSSALNGAFVRSVFPQDLVTLWTSSGRKLSAF